MNGFGVDVRVAWRTLRRHPTYAATVVLIFALSIGVTGTIVSYLDALVLRPPPYSAPDELVRVNTVRGGKAGQVSAQEVVDMRLHTQALADIASFRTTQYTLTGDGPPEVALAAMTSWNLFRVLGVLPMLGETWPESDDRTRQFKVVISHRLWQQRFGADRAIVGKGITLDSYPYVVLGVMPAGFDFPAGTDLWRRVPRQDFVTRSIRRADVVARLAPGAMHRQAEQELAALATRLKEEAPESNAGVTFAVSPLRALWIGDGARYALLLSVAVFLVLVLASATVANLVFARLLAREREMAVRVALGAGATRLMRGVAVEMILLAVIGAALGVLLTHAGVATIDAILKQARPGWMDVSVNLRVVLIAIVAATGVGLAAGAIPSWIASRLSPQDAMRERSSTGSGRGLGWRRALVTAQVALAMPLLVGAGLMTRSLQALGGIDAGFDAERLLTLRVDPPWTRFATRAATIPYYAKLRAAIAEVPGVAGVAMVDALPLAERDAAQSVHQNLAIAEGWSAEERERAPAVNLQMVSPGYFGMMGIAFARGRDFATHDDSTKASVAVVSERLAERFWPQADPIGKRLQLGELDANYMHAAGAQADSGTARPWVTVIGVVRDVAQGALSTEKGMDLYVSDQQYFVPETFIAVRTRAGNPRALLDAVRAAITRVDPDLGVFDVRLMEDRIADGAWDRRLSGMLLGAFGVLALVLAALGIYGVVSYAVAQRTAEMGVRLALGATPGSVLGLVLREGGRLAAVGIVIGLVLAIALGSGARAMWYGVSATDPIAIGGAALILGATALAAILIPARRASRLSPVEALNAR